jgi:hypothetical protein
LQHLEVVKPLILVLRADLDLVHREIALWGWQTVRTQSCTVCREETHHRSSRESDCELSSSTLARKAARCLTAHLAIHPAFSKLLNLGVLGSQQVVDPSE